jgi:ketosteroid isomerase-like protein
MAEPSFATPQAAEEAFYAALGKRDLEDMMNVWAFGEEVFCIHPGGNKLKGHESVRESWRQIFAGESQLRFHVTNQHCLRGPTLAVHIVHEEITIAPWSLRPTPIS